MNKKVSSESVVKDIGRRTRKKYSDLPDISGQLIKLHSFSRSLLG